MRNNKEKTDLTKRLVEGLEKAYQKLVESKRLNDGELVVMEGDKLVKKKP